MDTGVAGARHNAIPELHSIGFFERHREDFAISKPYDLRSEFPAR
jgi:hypothetical protein